jgi:hypothetical protein
VEKQLKVIRITKSDVKQIKSILHWQHKRGGEAHCLIRIFICLTQPKAIAVISEIESNPPGLEVTDDFAGVAEALIRLFRTDIESKLKDLVWVVHHGWFSFFEVLNQETFTRVDLKWKGQHIECDLSDWHLLQASEIQILLDGIELEPVQEVLKDLDWK